MLQARSFTQSAGRILACALLLSLPAAPASALVIDLSLNVLYTVPANPMSGGTWELVVKTDGSGLAGLSARLTNITPTAQNLAPRGLVNGDDPAGFAFITNTADTGHRLLTFGQVPSLNPPEQTAFYGVGTLVNGTPGFIGPAFTSLTNVQGVPWATGDTFGDVAWATGVKLASGPFAAGVTPGFFENGPDDSRGDIFTEVGSSMLFGPISMSITAETIVRTNFVATPSNGDYNRNGIVDAADYIVWRNTLGLTTPLDADGDGSGTIDAGDYTVWRMKFGNVIGPGAASGAAVVPEPSAAMLIAIGGAFVLFHRRRLRQGNRRKSAPGEVAAATGALKMVGTAWDFTPFRARMTRIHARHQTVFRQFSGRFFQLLISNEKRSIEGGNCLTAPKTANIMPKGSRTAGVSTSWGHLIGRLDCASWQGFVGNAHRGCAGQKKVSRRTARRLSAPIEFSVVNERTR